MRIPRFLPALRTTFLPKAAAVAALATVLTTAGFGAGANASTGATSCEYLITTDTMVGVNCDASPARLWRVVGKWCSSGFNCDTVLGNWSWNRSRSTAYHPGGKHFTRWWIMTQ
ncbi:hypothetical protein ACIBHY_31640 [Nonomuraea sp. NPDC050547]|uniref:hypothetical protein n=1 Tax=Nonomuraea sp. NPDC050547 TaxID=3364368 RepID=UPI0037BA8247